MHFIIILSIDQVFVRSLQGWQVATTDSHSFPAAWGDIFKWQTLNIFNVRQRKSSKILESETLDVFDDWNDEE